MRRLQTLLAILYAGSIYVFIFLPVAVLVLFSCPDGTLPVPPHHGVSQRWYEAWVAHHLYFKLYDGRGPCQPPREPID